MMKKITKILLNELQIKIEVKATVTVPKDFRVTVVTEQEETDKKA